MQLNILNHETNKAKGTIDVSTEVFDQVYNEPLIHQVVTAYLAGGRAGTKAQKSRSEVRGGGKKPWKQKGTGRARAGSSRSPIWRSGARAFAAKPRDFSQKVNKKMYIGAMRSMLSELVRQERLVVIEDLNLDTPKTKLLVEKLKGLSISDALIITDQANINLEFASRNIINIGVLTAKHIDPVSLVNFEKILVTVAALKQLEESLA